MSAPIERVEYLFMEALGRSPTERRKYLEQMCQQDQSLQAEVEALLRAHAEGTLGPAPPRSEKAAASPAANDEWQDKFLGTRVGPYKLLEKIGEGGCGAVYLAEQAEPIRRRVALKIIKLGMDTREVIARFQSERQTLALMEHPNIARVFECGATDEGRPYFVMEWVQGVSIIRFCQDRRLPQAKRLELFILVCRAIQHAHEKGVIHRDIKPSNILVTICDGMPTPKVIDFGVAKATEARPSGETLFTSFDQFIGTPLYMSPEQAELGSAGLDARSDIYSLGVLLYELLTEHTPFETQGHARSSFEEMRRRVREDDAPPPSQCLASLAGTAIEAIARSRGADTRKLVGALRGDLDWIVMRCLEKDPARRYSTAVGLAEEIARYLRQEPIMATAPGLGVALRRLARRHRTRLQIAGVSVAVVAAGASAWLWSRHAQANAAATVNVKPSVAISPHSLAVLPFSNLSADPANAFFADGVHEDLINNLAKIHDLDVTSRTSVMAYRQGPRNLRAIGEDLNVGDILEGTVMRSGDQVRVTVQLFDASNERPLWAETYTRRLTDVFSIQSELAAKIAGSLEASLTTDERRLIERRPTTSPEAYDLYLKARAMDDQLGNLATLADYEPVLALYSEAAAKDPKFALAYTQIAMLDLKLYWFSHLDATEHRLALAQAAAEAAVRVAPDDPETKLLLGHLDYHVQRNWRRALLEFESAQAGMPNNDQAIFAIGFTLRRLGQWNESVEHLEHAAALNPRSISESLTLIETLFLLRRYQQVIDFGRQYLVRFPESRKLADYMLRAAYEMDRNRQAFLRGWDALPPDPYDPLDLFDRFEAAVNSADWTSAERAISDPRLTQIPDFLGVTVDPPALYRAMVANLQGDREAAGRFADAAIAYYRGSSSISHEKSWVLLKESEAEAYAGRTETAGRDAEAAWEGVAGKDTLEAAEIQFRLGRIYAIIGRRDEALEILRKAMNQPCDWGPERIRRDPFWSRLADDPRFEAILGSPIAL